MEQRETPQDPAARPELPDPKGALPIPAHFRLPFHGKMATPTAVPSETERRNQITYLSQRRRKRLVWACFAVTEVAIVGLGMGYHAPLGTILGAVAGAAVVFAAILFGMKR